MGELGGIYGDLPVHDGLWESALATAGSLQERLAIEHMVHEGRGIDVMPKTIARFSSAGDATTAKLLKEILADEATHVGAGVKWFSFLAKRSDSSADPIPLFHEVVRRKFAGVLKAPFNEELRASAGMTPEWYMPLTVRQ